MRNIFFTHLLLLFFYSCGSAYSGSSYPQGVPSDAKFDRHLSLYSLSKNGRERLWTQDGVLYSDCEIVTGKNGKCKTYFSDGTTSSEGNTVNGDKDGLWTWYFPDGKTYVHQYHDHSKKRIYWMSTQKIGNEHGEYKRYYSSGSLELEGSYDGGYKQGLWRKYYPEGSLEFMGSYQKDKKVGQWFYYHPNSKLYAIEEYSDHSTLRRRELYYDDGSLRYSKEK
jgi:antitoxin component YwqK of YwqJK toxin-antitoxin module